MNSLFTLTLAYKLVLENDVICSDIQCESSKMTLFWSRLSLCVKEGSFKERLFPEALLSLFLSGGMIFISHLLRRLYYSSLNQHCIICLDHLHLILLRHIIADIE